MGKDPSFNAGWEKIQNQRYANQNCKNPRAERDVFRMTIIRTIDHGISTPARKLADFANERRMGADIKIAREYAIIGNVAIAYSSIVLGFYIFSFVAITVLAIFLKNPKKYGLPPGGSEISLFLNIIIIIFSAATIISAAIIDHYIIAIMGIGFFIHAFADQIVLHRIKNQK